MRAKAVVSLVVIALLGCEGPLGTIAKPGEGTGGAGPAGAAPEIDPNAVHPGVELAENALNGVVAGKIAEMNSTLVIVTDADGHRFWLTLTPHTVITKDGQPTSALDLKDGEPLTASFATRAGRRELIRADLAKQ